jgi:hypothetical protein
MNEENISICCGADLDTPVSNDGPTWSDIKICPLCNDHC